MRQGLNLNDIQNKKKLTSFETVRENIAETHSLKYADRVVSMETVKITPELHMEVPGAGVFSLTSWARRQVASIVGVQWDKWFDPEHIKPAEIQEELQRRFSRTHDQRKLRLSKFKPGSPGVQECDGYIRAVLSPTYHPIDDEKVFDRLGTKYGAQISELAFMRDHLSKTSNWGNDHCNHYSVISKEPTSLGMIDRNSDNPAVRRIYDLAEREGKLPDMDYVYHGYHIRNSEVGFTAITIDEFNFRLVCLNGAMMCVGDSRLLYRQHRPIDDVELDRQLGDVFDKGPKRWAKTNKNFALLREIPVSDPPLVIEKELVKREAPKHFRDASVKAFDLEPLPNMFGVVQAVTRAAQGYDDMDQRFDFESIAGRIIDDAAKLHA